MFVLVYDGSIFGLFSALFESFRLHLNVKRICTAQNFQEDMFCKRIDVETKREYAERIKRGIERRAGKEILEILYRAYLFEEFEIDMKIFLYLRRLFGSEGDFSAKNPLSKELAPLLRASASVMRERDLYLGMVRFQKVDDSLYAAKISPKYDVLTLMGEHFKRRLKDEKWLIYDEKRKYGLFYDLQSVIEVEIENFKLPHENDVFVEGWKAYYRSSFIKERKNEACMRRMLPGRYWDYLPERTQNLH